jgi:hypothetical protein
VTQFEDPGDFDFLLSTWNVVNRRRKIWSILEEPERNNEVEWEEFPAVGGMGRKLLDGRMIVDHYEGTFPGGLRVLGATIRAYDPETKLWSLVWLDNRQPPDFTPLLGRFEDGVGRFEQDLTTKEGRPLKVRFIWDDITSDAARWRQELSLDGSENWDTNWLMEFTK